MSSEFFAFLVGTLLGILFTLVLQGYLMWKDEQGDSDE